MNSVLVTGGAGYIGSHTIVALLQAGYNVVSVDNYSNSKPTVYKGIEKICGRKPTIVEGDCTDPTAMRKLFHQYGP
ncbi:MAG: SDR family NAD(P)-dependent oxidoreductase, partial [Bacteroidales bacterium]|nr:SDR family NAD(P)-dependent oxidoreductase [Bacteroidales bacterium]